MPRRYVPIDPERLPDELADFLLAASFAGPALRVAVDGPPTADPTAVAESLREPLLAGGRASVHVRAETFWRDASLRLEHGRHDLLAFRSDWLDTAALIREVLTPLGPDGTGEYLPSLRDPATNRATRAARLAAAPGTIAVVSGSLLLGRGLPFDVTIHLAMGAGARARRTADEWAEWAWTLPAFDEYDRDVDPVHTADVVVRLNDPRHPAISR